MVRTSLWDWTIPFEVYDSSTTIPVRRDCCTPFAIHPRVREEHLHSGFIKNSLSFVTYNIHPGLDGEGQQLRKAKDFQLVSVLAARCPALRQVVSGVRSLTRSYLLLDLGFRIFINTRWIVIVATLAFTQTATAEPYTVHTDVEFRLGAGVLCGTCADNDEHLSRTIKMTAQIFADRLFPVTTIGDGVFEIGPYVKGALLDGVNIPLIAGGGIVGYRVGKYEILVNGGFGYATERIGENTSNGVIHPGQTKYTYDLGFSVRYDIERYFISAGYQHNSNGTGFDIEYAHGKGSNPGYDNVFAGVGIRF
jgi:hypothetical protein